MTATAVNRIDRKFAELRERGQTAFLPFITVGDPDLDTTVDILLELEKAGASGVELGVPYSDPLADGPVIQRSSLRALKGRQVSIIDVMQTAKKARAQGCELPFILFSYFNPVLQLGLERAMQLAQENEISGFIIPDLPMEEDEEVQELARKYGLHLIPLVAPTSNERIRQIVSRASGFVYCVSSLGVTGTRSEFHSGIDEFLQTVKEAAGELPMAIGFGVSTHEQFERFSQTCDGIVVGSAIVRVIEEANELLKNEKDKLQGLQQIHQFVRQLIG